MMSSCTRIGLPLVFLVAAVASASVGCGGGSGSSGRSGVQALERFAQQFDSAAVLKQQPHFRPSFELPPPPPVATRAADSVESATNDIASDYNVAASEVKSWLCADFGYYVKTGTPVPDAEGFAQLVAGQLFGRLLPSGPIELRFRSKLLGIRDAIEAAEGEDEATRNAAIAIACAI